MQKEEAEQGCTISYLVNTPLGQLGVCRMCHLTGQNQVSYLALLGLTMPKFSGDVPARGGHPPSMATGSELLLLGASPYSITRL